ncbi:hypothetical protein DFR30_1515 [Thiogranum longum]|uniref:Uncharacterized protein n=1 Tax=Thiogranum longum TaxID=1537524 RepID=A0A4R1HDL0_9GAMM|nr:hypothetical protein [Thiogranum longum]TCK18240.1 hypothetical protein DFR30_1515 [Thiogranum longum]
MNLTVCKKICTECPFSKSSLRGWLGSHTLEGVLDAQQQEKLFSCHLQRKDGMTVDDIEQGDVKICRGFLVSASRSGITYGQDSETGSALGKLQQLVASEGMENTDTILSREEFEAHHGSLKLSRKINLPQDVLNRRLGYPDSK